jgi:3'-phosphoadenosine 5'-phosphosulfate sulfotransferase (PAPS reductase)/FAD synthetase
MVRIPNLRKFDVIVVNSSGGKDSQAQLEEVVRIADSQHVSRSKIVVAHADLGRAEWAGVEALVHQQAAHYGLRVIVARNEKRDLLEQTRQRGKWPSSQQRWCTSDHKRAPINRIYTQLVRELNAKGLKRKVRILNCLGFRAQESPARAKRPVWEINEGASNKTKRTVYNWLPIHQWSEETVWARIRASGVPHHPAYDLGMGRLSCVFCIFAPKAALQIAGRANPELLDQYVAVEDEIGHTFQSRLSLREVRDSLKEPLQIDAVGSWGNL